MDPKLDAFLRNVKSLDKDKVVDLLQIRQDKLAHDLVKELLEDYLEHYAKRIKMILKTFEGPDFKALHHEMHAIKSCAGNLGGMKLSRLCSHIHDLAAKEPNNGTIREIQALAEEFEVEFISLEKEMKKLCELL